MAAAPPSNEHEVTVANTAFVLDMEIAPPLLPVQFLNVQFSTVVCVAVLLKPPPFCVRAKQFSKLESFTVTWHSFVGFALFRANTLNAPPLILLDQKSLNLQPKTGTSFASVSMEPAAFALQPVKLQFVTLVDEGTLLSIRWNTAPPWS